MNERELNKIKKFLTKERYHKNKIIDQESIESFVIILDVLAIAFLITAILDRSSVFAALSFTCLPVRILIHYFYDMLLLRFFNNLPEEEQEQIQKQAIEIYMNDYITQ